MKRSKLLAVILIIAMLVICFTGCGNGEAGGDAEVKPIVWKFATNIYEDSEFATALVEMFDRWNEETNGEVTVEPYYQGALGAEADVVQNLQTGNIQVGYFSFALLSQFEPAWNVMDLPFLFKDAEHFKRYAGTEEAKAFFASFQEHGLWFDTCGIQAFRQTNLAKKNIDSIDGYKGLTLRTMDNVVQMDTVTALGAIPITVPYTDVYNGLKMGVADGWIGVYTGMNEISSYEPAPYVCEVPMFAAVIGIVLSEKALDELSDESAETVKAIYSEMMPHILEVAAAEDTSIRDKLVEEGKIQVNTIEDLTPFVEKVAPVWDKIIEKYDGVQEQLDIINSVK